MDVFDVVAGPQREYLRNAALRAAAELGLAAALPGTPEEAAARLRLPAGGRLRRLLDVLALFACARREGDVFHARFDPPEPAPDAGWGRLAEVIRSGRPVPEPGVGGEGDPEALRRFHAYLREAGRAPARELWSLLPSSSGPLLDLGSGAGTYALAFLQAFDGARATLADRAGVLALAEVPGAALLPLDLLSSELPPGQGVVLLANLLHLFGPADCRKLVARAARALRPGGSLVIKDLLIAPDRSGPEASVLFALNMALFTEGGDVHDPHVLQGWLAEAGLLPARRLSLRSSPGSVVLVAEAPAAP